MAAYAAPQDQFRDSVQSSVYSTDSSYYDQSPLDSLLENYPRVPGASPTTPQGGYRSPDTPRAHYTPGVPSRLGASSTPADIDSGMLRSELPQNGLPLRTSSRSPSPTSSSPHRPTTSIVPPTPTISDYSTTQGPDPTINNQHLSALSAPSQYSAHDSWVSDGSSNPNIRETWRSSASGTVDPFSFRHFETQRPEPPTVVVHSPSVNDAKSFSKEQETAEIHSLPTPIAAEPPGVSRAMSQVSTIRYNFSRPIRENSGTSSENSHSLHPTRNSEDSESSLPYFSAEETKPKAEVEEGKPKQYKYNRASFLAALNLAKTTPSSSFHDDNFTHSPTSDHDVPLTLSPVEGSPTTPRPELYQDAYYNAPSHPEVQRAPSLPEVQRDLSPSPHRNHNGLPTQDPRNLSPTHFHPPPNPINDPRYTQDGSHSSATNSVVLPRNPPPLHIRPGSTASIYSTYSFYSAGDLPSGATTPKPGMWPRKGSGSSDDGPVTPTQPFAARSAPDLRQMGGATTFAPPPPIPASGPVPEVEQDLENPTTPLEFLALGIMHHEAGRLEESAHWFERSATERGGCGVGMLMWGLTLRHAWGAEKDERSGFNWLRRAAEVAVEDMERVQDKGAKKAVKSELVLAIYEVGQCFFHGWGVEQDKKMAVVASRLGDMDAQQELAFCYANGKGTKKNLKEAAKWYRAAVEQGASPVGLAWIYKPKYAEETTKPEAPRSSFSSFFSRKGKEPEVEPEVPISRLLSPNPEAMTDTSTIRSRNGPRKLKKVRRDGKGRKSDSSASSIVS